MRQRSKKDASDQRSSKSNESGRKRGGQPGNQNAVGRGAWSGAIRRALARASKARLGGGAFNALNCCADTLVRKALSGDIQALKEIGDRLDGKPVRAINKPGGSRENKVTTAVDYLDPQDCCEV